MLDDIASTEAKKDKPSLNCEAGDPLRANIHQVLNQNPHVHVNIKPEGITSNGRSNCKMPSKASSGTRSRQKNPNKKEKKPRRDKPEASKRPSYAGVLLGDGHIPHTKKVRCQFAHCELELPNQCVACGC